MSYNLKFIFRKANEAQKGILANLSVELWSDNLCVISTNGWSIRTTKDGSSVFASPPAYKGSDGKWRNYIFMFPSNKEGADNTGDEYKKFQEGVINAYNEWVVTGGTGQSNRVQAPRPQAQAPGLAPGWVRNVDARSGRAYYQGPNNEIIFEGDPALAGIVPQQMPVMAAPVIPVPPTPSARPALPRSNPFLPPSPNRG